MQIFLLIASLFSSKVLIAETFQIPNLSQVEKYNFFLAALNHKKEIKIKEPISGELIKFGAEYEGTDSTIFGFAGMNSDQLIRCFNQFHDTSKFFDFLANQKLEKIIAPQYLEQRNVKLKERYLFGNKGKIKHILQQLDPLPLKHFNHQITNFLLGWDQKKQELSGMEYPLMYYKKCRPGRKFQNWLQNRLEATKYIENIEREASPFVWEVQTKTVQSWKKMYDISNFVGMFVNEYRNKSNQNIRKIDTQETFVLDHVWMSLPYQFANEPTKKAKIQEFIRITSWVLYLKALKESTSDFYKIPTLGPTIQEDVGEPYAKGPIKILFNGFSKQGKGKEYEALNYEHLAVEMRWFPKEKCKMQEIFSWVLSNLYSESLDQLKPFNWNVVDSSTDWIYANDKSNKFVTKFAERTILPKEKIKLKEKLVSVFDGNPNWLNVSFFFWDWGSVPQDILDQDQKNQIQTASLKLAQKIIETSNLTSQMIHDWIKETKLDQYLAAYIGFELGS